MAVVVARWNVKGQELSLFQEGTQLVVRREGGTGSPIILNPYYGADEGARIVAVYASVIQANLEEKVCAPAFTPLLCKDVVILREGRYRRIDVQAVLFGRRELVDASPPAYRYVVRWGIHDRARRTVERIACDPISRTTESFILELARKATLAEQASYAEETTIVAELGSGGEMRFIDLLRNRSAYDRTVLLGERYWSVTVLSANGSVFSDLPVSGREDLGHAMIAFEGVRDGQWFQRYAHLTTSPLPGGETLGTDEARVDIRDFPPRDLSHGPTWVRTRQSVEEILQPIQEAQSTGRRVIFSRTRDVAVKAFEGYEILLAAGLGLGLLASPPIFFGVIVPIGGVLGFGFVAHAGANTRTLVNPLGAYQEFCHNCASWVRQQLTKGGIEIGVPPLSITPRRMVEALNSGAATVTFR